MKNILLSLILFMPIFNAHAYDKSECDGASSWKYSPNNSPDLLTRTCDVFGMNYIEIKSQLNENRCIVVKNMKTGNQWKHFFLRKQSIKALPSPNLDPNNFEVTSKNASDNRCNS
jgi:hypothetical protein